ncbi:MAG: hypothetical protein OHK0037_31780 [Elainellaceae cyanobacterium]
MIHFLSKRSSASSERLPVYKTKTPTQKLLLAAIALGIALGSFPVAALAQDYVPPNRGLPGRREGGGTRGCWTSNNPGQNRLTAIVPAQNLGYTLSEYPTLFVYVPASYAEKAAAAELILTDDQDNEIYRATFSTGNQSGILRISLPAEANMAPLEIGRDYHWSFALVCDPNDPSGNLVVDSWIQRVQPSAELSAAIATASPADLPALYAQSGIWYEAIASLADPYRQPTDETIVAQWQNLLNSVGLGSIASELPTATPGLSRLPQP